VGPRTGLAAVEKRKLLNQLGLELPPFGRPARSLSLYRLLKEYDGRMKMDCLAKDRDYRRGIVDTGSIKVKSLFSYK
jgi:hypothetical protein